MKNKRQAIQEQYPDHEYIRKQNEINLQPVVQVYRMYTELHTVEQAEQVAESLSQIDFIQKQCEKNMKVRDFALYAAQFFKYEYYNFGQTIMNQGDYGDRFYLLLYGEVGVYTKRSNEDVQNDLDILDQQSIESNIKISNEMKKKQTVFLNQPNKYELALRMLIDNSNYYKKGVPLFKKVWQYYSGQCFGDQALIHDQPRSASIIVVSDEVHLISMNKHDFRLICEKQIKEQYENVNYFMKLFNGASKFTVTKFIQNLRIIQFQSQTILWKEGDEPKFYFLIIKGRIQLFKQISEELFNKPASRKKKKIILSQLSDNSFVGLEEIIESFPYRLYSCQVLDKTKAYFMEASEFNNLKKNFPDIVQLLKDKSSLITEYMNNRLHNIISLLSQQETIQNKQPQIMITERKTVEEIFNDPHDRPNKNDIRSKKPILHLQTEIANQNKLYHQKKLLTDSKTKFLMVDTNHLNQIRDRESRKVSAVEKKIRVKTTHLEDNQILINRISSSVSTKQKKMQLIESSETGLQITTSEPYLTSPTFLNSTTNSIPLIQRSWNPKNKQFKAKSKKDNIRIQRPNQIEIPQTEKQNIFLYFKSTQRIHTAQTNNRKLFSASCTPKKSDQILSDI